MMDVLKQFGWPSIDWCLYLCQMANISSSNQVTVRYEGDTHWSRNRISLVIYTKTATNLVQKNKQNQSPVYQSNRFYVWRGVKWLHLFRITFLWLHLPNPCVTPCPNWRQASSLVILPVAWKSKPRNKARVAVKPCLTWVPLESKKFDLWESLYTNSKEFIKRGLRMDGFPSYSP